MASWRMSHQGEEQAMPEQVRVWVQEQSGAEGPRFVGQKDRDERLFRLAYAEDHAREFKRALLAARAAFLVRMAVLA
jgi:hypothetical protein